MPAGQERSPADITATAPIYSVDMPGSWQRRPTGYSRAAACFRTTWGCLICSGIRSNGAGSSGRLCRDGIGRIVDMINTYEQINTDRVLRGGAVSCHQEDVRSANRSFFAPAYRSSDFGFRPARAYH